MSSPDGDESKSALVYPSKGQPVVVQGYPSPSGGYPAPPYNGYAQPQTGYPNPPPNYPKPVPAPSAAYYTSSQLPNLYPDQKQSFTFARIVLCMMIVLVVGAVLISILMWLVFGSDVPGFQVTAFSIPNFDISNSTLTAIWELNVTVVNPNHKLLVTFDHIEGNICYKQALLDNALVETMQLRKDEIGTMRMKFEVPSPLNNSPGAFWLKDMENDRKNGNIDFDLRMIMAATFSSGAAWRRQTTLRTLCGDLKVKFSGSTRGGTWLGNTQDCILFN